MDSLLFIEHIMPIHKYIFKRLFEKLFLYAFSCRNKEVRIQFEVNMKALKGKRTANLKRILDQISVKQRPLLTSILYLR